MMPEIGGPMNTEAFERMDKRELLNVVKAMVRDVEMMHEIDKSIRGLEGKIRKMEHRRGFFSGMAVTAAFYLVFTIVGMLL